MPLRTCETCGKPFKPERHRQRHCPKHELRGRAHRSPTTRAQRDGTGDYDRNRALVLAGNPLCHWGCGRPATTADHLKPVARGGTHDLANLVPACGRCNYSRGARARPKGR